MNPGRLLGRDHEVTALREALEAGHEHGSALLVIGEPGIGKSALLSVARGLALVAGHTVLSAVGVESEMHLPFGGLQQLLAPLIGGSAISPDRSGKRSRPPSDSPTDPGPTCS